MIHDFRALSKIKFQFDTPTMYVFTNILAKARCDTRSIFKRNLTGLPKNQVCSTIYP